MDTSLFQQGWTVFVRFAEARPKGGRMQDTLDGVFPDDPRLVTTVRAPLRDVLSYDQEIAERDHMSAAEVAAIQCCCCHERVATKLCTACRVVDYCSRECQVKDWKEHHRLACPIYASLRDIHAEVREEVQGEVPRSYSLREIASAPPEARIPTELTPFKHNALIEDEYDEEDRRVSHAPPTFVC